MAAILQPLELLGFLVLVSLSGIPGKAGSALGHHLLLVLFCQSDIIHPSLRGRVLRNRSEIVSHFSSNTAAVTGF